MPARVGPDPFNKREFDHVINDLRGDATNPEWVLSSIPIDIDTTSFLYACSAWAGFTHVESGPDPNPLPYRIMYLPPGEAGVATASLWRTTRSIELPATWTPIFIFLTVPDHVTDLEEAWWGLLCSLLSQLAEYVVDVPAREMRDAGVITPFVCREHFENHRGRDRPEGSRHAGNDGIMGLLTLVYALKNCTMRLREERMTSSGPVEVENRFLVIIDRPMRFFLGRGKDYAPHLQSSMSSTIVHGFGGRVLFLDELPDDYVGPNGVSEDAPEDALGGP